MSHLYPFAEHLSHCHPISFIEKSNQEGSWQKVQKMCQQKIIPQNNKHTYLLHQFSTHKKLLDEKLSAKLYFTE
jgi:hypothetical protein